MKSQFKNWLRRKTAQVKAAMTGHSATSTMYLTSSKLTLPQADYWTEEQVTPEQLLALFRQAFIPVESMSKGRLYINNDDGASVVVSVDTERKGIDFQSYYSFRDDAAWLEKLELVNRMNDKIQMVRFSVQGDDTLLADYLLLFNGGITPAAIVSALRRTSRITLQAIARMDAETDLVR